MSAFRMRRSRPPTRWSPPTSSKLRQIVKLLTPGLVFAGDGAAFARAIDATVPAEIEVAVARNPLPHRRDDRLRRARRDAADRRGRRRLRPHRARHHRQIPVHLRLDRRAQGGDQHPAHVVREPGADRRRARLFPGRAAGDRRLGAVAPHRRRQPRRRPRAAQRRHVLRRRRQAAAGRDRGDGAQPARGRADLVLHGAEGLRGAAALSARRRRSCAAPSSAGSRCCGSRAPASRKRVFDEIKRARGRDLRRAHRVPHRLRLDRDRALRARPHVRERDRQQHGRCRSPASTLKLAPQRGQAAKRG